MGLWSWLFGSAEKEEQCCGGTCTATKVDPRDVLAVDEEWVTPEEWFIDKDGKRVRRKRKKQQDEEECCGTCVYEGDGVDLGGALEDAVDAVAAVAVTGGSDDDDDVPLDGGNGNGDNPGYVDPDVPSSSNSTPEPAYTPPPGSRPDPGLHAASCS